MRLRKLTRMRAVNDGSRSLNGSVMNPELIIALRDWARSTDPGVLIGGLAIILLLQTPATRPRPIPTDGWADHQA